MKKSTVLASIFLLATPLALPASAQTGAPAAADLAGGAAWAEAASAAAERMAMEVVVFTDSLVLLVGGNAI